MGGCTSRAQPPDATDGPIPAGADGGQNLAASANGSPITNQFLDLEHYASTTSIGTRTMDLDRSLVATLSNPESNAELRDLFRSLDADGDACVSSREWGMAVAGNQQILSKYFGGATVSEIGRQFNRIDIDGDKRLTWSEFESGAKSLGAALTIAAALHTGDGNAELRGLFETLDKDSDGRVTAQEWSGAVLAQRAAIVRHFGGATQAELKQAFRRLDTDRSGDLSWKEFCDGAKKFAASQVRLARAHAQFDARKSRDAHSRGAEPGTGDAASYPVTLLIA